MKFIIGLIALAIVASGVYFFLWPHQTPTTDVSSSTTQNTGPGELRWDITDTGTTSPNGAPLTSVTLYASGTSHDLGTFEGSCSEINGTSWQLLQNETAGVICYFAGGGTELGIFAENNTFTLKKGDVSEGDAETPGTRGNFMTVTQL